MQSNQDGSHADGIVCTLFNSIAQLMPRQSATLTGLSRHHQPESRRHAACNVGLNAGSSLPCTHEQQLARCWQARWVWTIIVSCSLFLTIAIVAAVAAFAAAAFAVLPRDQFALAAVPLGVGMCSVGGVLLWLLRSTWASKPTKMRRFLGLPEYKLPKFNLFGCLAADDDSSLASPSPSPTNMEVNAHFPPPTAEPSPVRLTGATVVPVRGLPSPLGRSSSSVGPCRRGQQWHPAEVRSAWHCLLQFMSLAPDHELLWHSTMARCCKS